MINMKIIYFLSFTTIVLKRFIDQNQENDIKTRKKFFNICKDGS